MRRGSLRRHLAIGSILWTIGLVGITNAIILALVFHRFPGRFIHYGAIAAFAMGLLVMGLLQIRSLLAPFRRLQDELAEVREGRGSRVSGQYPVEVEPLVRDLNDLLETRERMVERAVARAGDLAHGLKTPLAVLAQEGERLRARGDHEGADALDQQLAKMRRQIEHQLAHARAQAGGTLPGASTPLAETLDGLIRALARIHAGKNVAFDTNPPRELCVAVARADLEEILGNVLDNACKWGRARVAVVAEPTGGIVCVTIDDDGPGIPPGQRTRVLERGVRADEASPGSGLGLAIVADLVEVYSGTLTIGQAPGGGARVRITLPSVARSAA